MELKRRQVSVPSADRLSSAIHYSLNASRCQLYYGKVGPDWRPHWGQKNGCKILLEVLGENKRAAVMDGCIWPMQGRRQRCSLTDETESTELVPPLPRAAQPCQGGEETRHGASVSASITCVKTDALHIQRINLCLTWRESEVQTVKRTDVRAAIFALKAPNTSFFESLR